ncbi:uncharacterized protein LOC122825664 isoform X2 [Gambusia affinis]|uniref:uncharacterized protein LOC122825664 isoform X2 n=1 Tax=Gambusia affinis TaxID=33528 RepID=UPI001CDC7177|nr:uncharacterized protein LOC122825664 isoform X2 [Gambusia affinis]
MISIFRSAAEKSLSVQQLIDGQEMLVLVLVLVVVLQFEGTRGKIHLYHREGENVVLPCNSPSSYYLCSIINWLYNRDMSPHRTEVKNGKVDQSSSRASRLNLDNSCSLMINNITADDAGLYGCIPGSGFTIDGVFLNVLTISPSPTDADPAKEDFTLLCSLVRDGEFGSCPDKSFLWLDETGSELTGEDDEYKSGGQIGCVSYLTVNLQSSRRFTCQFVEGNKVKIEAHYGSEGPPASSPLSFIMLTLKITGLILMVGITVGIIRTRGRKKPQKDVNVHFAVDGDSVNYENDGERSAAAALY